MKYLGTIENEYGTIRLPGGFETTGGRERYEAIAVGDDILLFADPRDTRRIEALVRLTEKSIEDHRSTLNGLMN